MNKKACVIGRSSDTYDGISFHFFKIIIKYRGTDSKRKPGRDKKGKERRREERRGERRGEEGRREGRKEGEKKEIKEKSSKSDPNFTFL